MKSSNFLTLELRQHRIADLSHDALILYRDLDIPLRDSVRIVVSESDFVDASERNAIVLEVTEYLKTFLMRNNPD